LEGVGGGSRGGRTPWVFNIERYDWGKRGEAGENLSETEKGKIGGGGGGGAFCEPRGKGLGGTMHWQFSR